MRRAGWRELLVDIKQRGPEIAPDLAVGDGALGFWKAIEDVFQGTRHQRCWVHKTANVLNKVALSVQINMKADLREIYGAPTRAAAEAAIDVFADKYGAKYGGRLPDEGSGSAVAFFDFLAEHWDHLLHQTRSRACSRRCPSSRADKGSPVGQDRQVSWCSNRSMPLRKRGDD